MRVTTATADVHGGRDAHRGEAVQRATDDALRQAADQGAQRWLSTVGGRGGLLTGVRRIRRGRCVCCIALAAAAGCLSTVEQKIGDVLAELV